MKELFVLAWHSYDELSTDLDGAVVGVYESLAEAQFSMKEQIEDTISYYENEEYHSDIQERNSLFASPNGYLINYYIESKFILLQ